MFDLGFTKPMLISTLLPFLSFNWERNNKDVGLSTSIRRRKDGQSKVNTHLRTWVWVVESETYPSVAWAPQGNVSPFFPSFCLFSFLPFPFLFPPFLSSFSFYPFLLYYRMTSVLLPCCLDYKNGPLYLAKEQYIQKAKDNCI